MKLSICWNRIFWLNNDTLTNVQINYINMGLRNVYINPLLFPARPSLSFLLFYLFIFPVLLLLSLITNLRFWKYTEHVEIFYATNSSQTIITLRYRQIATKNRACKEHASAFALLRLIRTFTCLEHTNPFGRSLLEIGNEEKRNQGEV